MFIWTIIIGYLLGSDWYAQDSEHRDFFASISGASLRSIGYALASGVVFNLANVLLTVLIGLVGLAVSFPICIGIGLIAGTLLDYAVQPGGSALPTLSVGLALAFAALVSMGIAYYLKSKRDKEVLVENTTSPFLVIQEEDSTYEGRNSQLSMGKLIFLCVLAGCLMACFSPLSTLAQTKTASSSEGLLNPYSCMFFFSAAVLTSSVPLCFALAKMPLDGSKPLKSFLPSKGFSIVDICMPVLGSLVWTLGTMLNFVAGAKVSFAVAYSIGQAAPMAAALWGIFWFREFTGAPTMSWVMMMFMFVFYTAAIYVIATGSTD